MTKNKKVTNNSSHILENYKLCKSLFFSGGPSLQTSIILRQISHGYCSNTRALSKLLILGYFYEGETLLCFSRCLFEGC
jgi:hypothetical protein